MKYRLIITGLLMLAATTLAAQDNSIYKERICNQLLGESSGRRVLADISVRLFPEGVDTDQCLMELVADTPPSAKKVLEMARSQRADGSWSDVEYTSRSRSAWPAQRHNERLMSMAKVYLSGNSPLKGSKELSDAIHKGISYWSTTKPECPNWWYNEIGVPKVFAPLLLLMQNEFTSEELAAAMPIIERSQIKMTGQNKVWLSGIVFIRALLTNDEELLAKSSEAIRSEVVVTTDEGIQPDYSFHQHGAQQQFGNYGLAFASSQSYWMRMLADTKYDFSPEQRVHLRRYMVDGVGKTVWRGVMDISARGRQLFHNSGEGKAGSLALSMINMTQADTAYKKSYENYIARNYMNAPNDVKGMTHFYRSDYSVYRAPDFMVSIKMCSPRVEGAETTNRENISGYYTADGAMYTYRTGREYENIFPLWNWRRIPGTTCYDTDEAVPYAKNRQGHDNKNPFVGGLEASKFGISAMALDRDGLQGCKSYFFTPDGVVCLGAALTNDKGLPMTTSIEQSLASGDVQTTAQSGKAMRRGQVVTHNGIGYVALDNSIWNFGSRRTEGEWSRVADFYPSEKVYGDIFSLWITHPTGSPASYAYIVAPSVDAAKLTKKSGEVKIIANNDDAQSVGVGGTIMAVFYRPSAINTAQGRIKVNAPCLLTLCGGKLYVADPTHTLTDITVQIGAKKVNIALPAAAHAGKTVEQTL